MKNLALSRIQAMKPYSPPLNGRSNYDGLLLDFNERTKSPAQPVLTALKQLMENPRLQLYPEYFDLTKKIADYAKVDASQVMITNGTDQAIEVIFRTFTDTADTVIIPEPTFAMFGQTARVVGNHIIAPLYKSDSLAFPLQEVVTKINDDTKLVVICNPNNPTGTLVSLKDIERIAKKATNAIIYIDEAYFEFSGCSAARLIKKYPNIIVSRTFSKAFGLAGLRIGYVIAQADYISEMLKVRGPYDINQIAYCAASATIANVSDMTRYSSEVMNRAKPLVEQFFKYSNIPFYDSAANFILFRPENPERVAKILIDNGILVRPQNKLNVEGMLRVTIGTVDQMKQFIEIYKTTVLTCVEKYAFLDRDGTLIYEPQDTYQVDSIDKLEILDGAIEGLQELQSRGYKLAMVSNQDGLGTASFPEADFVAPQNRMLQIFKDAGVEFEQIFICPHFAEDKCDCRKPQLGLLKDFLQKTAIDTEFSFVCGDRAGDSALAENLGLRAITMPTNGNFRKAIKPILKRST